MQISEIPEGRYCTDYESFKCKFFDVSEEDDEAWCDYYENYIDGNRKCAPCAHPEI